MTRARCLVAVLVAIASPACSPSHVQNGVAVIMVNAPFAQAGELSKSIERGAILAAEQINSSGGIQIDGRTIKLEIRRTDSEYSSVQTADNARSSAGAVAIIDEGTGVDASWDIALGEGIPIDVAFQGSESLIDPARRPNVFRMAVTNRGQAFRFAEYLVPQSLRIAILHDDSSYGLGGAQSLRSAFEHNAEAVAGIAGVSRTAFDLAPQILQARHSGATAVLIWGRPATIGLAIRAARSVGWNVPIYAPSAGWDPLVRQELADHPNWIEGLTVSSGRMTSEIGTGPFEAFRDAFSVRFGLERVGVLSSGHQVVVPPELSMYSFDFVRLVASAMKLSKSARGSRALIDAMEKVAVQGANGDQRGFNPNNHEGIADDDVFFSACHSMVFEPVKDDALSSSLPTVVQTL